MRHKFLSIVRAFEMEIPPANVLLFLETRNLIVWQFPTFMFILCSKSEIGVYISRDFYCIHENEGECKFLWDAGGMSHFGEKWNWTMEKEEVHE